LDSEAATDHTLDLKSDPARDMTRKIAIGKGWQLKDGKLVPCYKHLPVNLRLQKRASNRVRPTGREAEIRPSASCGFSSGSLRKR
jgi:hypothetical protein